MSEGSRPRGVMCPWPNCSSTSNTVRGTWDLKANNTRVRKRICNECHREFTTHEHIVNPEPTEREMLEEKATKDRANAKPG